VQYLINCRQHSIGMGNLIKYLRYTISQIAPDCSEDRAKNTVTSALAEYLAERIINSRNCISQDVCFPSIKEHDVILTFGSSPLVRQILLETAARGRRFRVIIVDARPLHDGRATMQACAAANIPCMYTNLAGVNFVMDQATRVLMGASAVLSNGAVLAPAGTAMIASIARAHRVPTMFAAESYKFSFKVQLDSVVYNELGNIDEIATPMEAVTGAGGNGSGAGGSGSAAAATAAAESEEGASDLVDAEGNIVPAFSRPQTDGVYRGAAEGDKGPGARLPYSVINLRYDLTPICNVSVVATESGLIPPTSIPILIKEYNKQQGHGAGATSAAAAMNVA
jgi:translation initiation factor eIF-2B subunit delta